MGFGLFWSDMPFKNAVLIRASNCCLYKNTYVKRMYFIVDT